MNLPLSLMDSFTMKRRSSIAALGGAGGNPVFSTGFVCVFSGNVPVSFCSPVMTWKNQIAAVEIAFAPYIVTKYDKKIK